MCRNTCWFYREMSYLAPEDFFSDAQGQRLIINEVSTESGGDQASNALEEGEQEEGPEEHRSAGDQTSCEDLQGLQDRVHGHHPNCSCQLANT